MRIFILFLILSPFQIFCQSSIIQVIDQSLNEPLIGATVQYNDGNAVTDLNGNFEYSPSSYPDKITITFIGYADKVIYVNSLTDVPSKIYLNRTYRAKRYSNLSVIMDPSEAIF